MPEGDPDSTSIAGDDPALAAVVPNADAEAAIDALQAEGVYDHRRSVKARDDDTVAIPVSEPPASTAVLEVVRQTDPDPRLTDLESHLAARGWTDEEIDRAPGSWAVIGSVVLVTFENCPRREEVGDALLDIHGEADTVLAREGVSGTRREPSVDVVAGTGDTETIHTEHGTRYALDLSRVMFSPGNKAERGRMGDVVRGNAPPAVETNRDGPERVFDMFAGIGYFTLPMARADAHVTAAEINPVAFQYLLENAALNDVTDRIDAYRGDCRDVADTLSEPVDRVVMGYYDAFEYLPSALSAVAVGGVLHVHEATPNNLLWDRPVSRIEDAAAEAGRDVEILDRRRVKTHSEGVTHVVVDVRVR